MHPDSLYPAGLAAIAALTSGAAAISAHRSGRHLKWIVPVSGTLLLGVAAFGLLPEVAEEIGWWHALSVAIAAFVFLFFLDRLVFPHSVRTAGFATPLVIATAIHASIDGWGLVTVQMAGTGLASSIAVAIILHKIPEGLALGGLLRAATGRNDKAFALCVLAETPTLLGALAGLSITPTGWVQYALALAAGTFLFLGVHAVLEFVEMRRNGLPH